MPELPEVETTAAGLRQFLLGESIVQVKFHRPNLRYPLDPAWRTALANARFTHIERRAKYLIITLAGEENPVAEGTAKENVEHIDQRLTKRSTKRVAADLTAKHYLLCHLGMSGSFRLSQTGEALRLHDHVEIFLKNELILRYHDPRRFGFMRYFKSRADLDQQLIALGPEPLSRAFHAAELFKRSRGKKQAIKGWIMDQHTVVGVGNIYACEALFLSGIAPQRTAHSLSLIDYQRLVKHIKRVLQQAISQGGTTLKDFLSVEEKPGYFQQKLLVYGRAGQACTICSQSIGAQKIAGRNSFFCPHCQT